MKHQMDSELAVFIFEVNKMMAVVLCSFVSLLYAFEFASYQKKHEG